MRGILTYHSIDISESPVSVRPSDFERQVAWLANSDVEVVGLEELLRRPPDGNACAITFDDAFMNFVETAWPILREHDLPVTLFVVSGHVGGTNAWGGRTHAAVPTLPLMDWSALGEVAEQGVTLGAHTRTHPWLTALSDEDLAEELEGSRNEIHECTGQQANAFAYPYGDHDRRVVAAAGRAYDVGVTTRLAPVLVGDDPLQLPRLDAFYLREKGRLEDWGTPRFERYIAFRRGLRRVRSVLSRGR